MARRSGLQAEVVASLALVMAAATGMIALLLVRYHEAALHDVLGRALSAEARAFRTAFFFVVPGTEWWEIEPGGAARPRGPVSEPIDADTRRLAQQARDSGATLLQPGSGAGSIRFATPLDPSGRVAAARLPPSASEHLRMAPRRVAVAVLAVDALVFTLFGATLLRRRVVRPLQRLRDAAESIAGGGTGARVPIEGSRETAGVARAFNAMTDALEGRTGALEKAVAELREANQKLRDARAGLDRAERLAAVGRLAAGVAHEVGNPMGAILAFLDLARRDPNLSPETGEHLARAGREGERVRTILRQLLDFSRPARGNPVPVDLVAVAEETVALVRAQKHYGRVAFQVIGEDEPPPALAEPSAVAQVMLNLVLNAADAALGAGEAGVELRVRGRASRVRTGEDSEAGRPRRRFDAVECSVSDNGAGVPEEDRERVFDPFYTTKDPGEGTGLGLANACRLAEEWGGAVELVDPGSGSGATFALRLPAAPVEGQGVDARRPAAG